MSIPSTNPPTDVISSVSGGVAWFAFVFFVAGVITLVSLGGIQLIPTLAGLALAVLTVISFVLGARYLRRLWALCWLVPSVGAGIFVVIWAEPIRAGIIPFGPIVFAWSLAYALALGFLIVARQLVRGWVQ